MSNNIVEIKIGRKKTEIKLRLSFHPYNQTVSISEIKSVSKMLNSGQNFKS